MTCVAFRECHSGQIKSFSLAEHLSKQATPAQQRAAELKLLNRFYSHMATRQGATIVHWNMNSATYGFAHLEARLALLGGQPQVIKSSNCLELSWALVELFGDDYIGKPRIRKLAERNGLTMLDFVDGDEEALAFGRKDFPLIQRSTIRKVQILSEFLNLAATSRLKTDRWEQNVVAWAASKPWTRWGVPAIRFALGIFH